MVMGELPVETEVLVLGGGPGGYTAAFRAADLGFDVTLVTDEPDLGRPPVGPFQWDEPTALPNSSWMPSRSIFSESA
jgi:flavin-dependent dehydrogenase